MWYSRRLGRLNQSLEGSTHADALLTFGDDHRVMFEARFLSDISYMTTYAVDRNQLTRNLDAGLASVNHELHRFFYVFISPQAFRDRPQARLYGYKLTVCSSTQ